MSTPALTKELQTALDASNGIVQGPSFVLMKTEVILDWFGYTEDDLRRELQPAIDQADRGESVEWNLQAFLNEMHGRSEKHGDENVQQTWERPYFRPEGAATNQPRATPGGNGDGCD